MYICLHRALGFHRFPSVLGSSWSFYNLQAHLKLKNTKRKTTQLPRPRSPSLASQSQALVTYNSWEDEDPPIPGTPMPTCRIDHRNAVRNTNRFLRNVLKDPVTRLGASRSSRWGSGGHPVHGMESTIRGMECKDNAQ